MNARPLILAALLLAGCKQEAKEEDNSPVPPGSVYLAGVGKDVPAGVECSDGSALRHARGLSWCPPGLNIKGPVVVYYMSEPATGRVVRQATGLQKVKGFDLDKGCPTGPERKTPCWDGRDVWNGPPADTWAKCRAAGKCKVEFKEPGWSRLQDMIDHANTTAS